MAKKQQSDGPSRLNRAVDAAVDAFYEFGREVYRRTTGIPTLPRRFGQTMFDRVTHALYGVQHFRRYGSRGQLAATRSKLGDPLPGQDLSSQYGHFTGHTASSGIGRIQPGGLEAVEKLRESEALTNAVDQRDTVDTDALMGAVDELVDRGLGSPAPPIAKEGRPAGGDLNKDTGTAKEDLDNGKELPGL